MTEISERARVLSTVFFSMNEKSELEIGGEHSVNKLGEKWVQPIQELIENGYVTATPFGKHNPGRMIYKGTSKLGSLKKVGLEAIERHNFSIAELNK